MSDKELDEILEEIKQRSAENAPETPAPEEPEIEEKPEEIAQEEVSEKISEPVEEEIPAEEPEAEIPEVTEPEVEAEPEQAEPVTDDAELTMTEEAVDEPEAEAEAVEEAAQEEAEEKTEGAIDILAVADDFSDSEPIRSARPEEKKSKRGVAIGIIAALIVIALGVGAYLYFSGYFTKQPEETTKPVEATTAAVVIDEGTANPLTGEYGFNKNALTLRPVAVVVENEYSTESVRPQWGIADADMVMEGETEFSTRLLFFWADMNRLPEQIGPSRSARPPFIRFSQMWDSIFIHTGLSRSKDNYEGADTVFENENIDHINLLAQSENGTYFGRDNSRQTAVEHTGYLNGTNVVELINNNKISTELRKDRFTQFEFNDKDEPMGETSATTATFKWSDRCPKKGVFTYDEAKGLYTTTDFDSRYGESNLQVKTLIYLLDETEYIVKENYKHAGSSETYCNYDLAGGEGKVLSMGTSVDVKWRKEDGKLVLETLDGKDVKLNRGKIYIGYGSSNHGGSIEVE